MCPSTSARNGSGARQPQGEPRAAFGRFRHQNVAAHRAGERAGNVEPQPAAFRILAEPLELGENPLPVGFGHAAALIVDRYSRLAFPHLQSQPDRTGVARKLHRVLDEVDEYLERAARSEEHTSELQSLMRISYAVFCLKQKK